MSLNGNTCLFLTPLVILRAEDALHVAGRHQLPQAGGLRGSTIIGSRYVAIPPPASNSIYKRWHGNNMHHCICRA